MHDPDLPPPRAAPPPPQSPVERVNWIVMLFRRGILTIKFALAALTGRAKVSFATLLMALFGAIYFVSPVDVLPDVIPVIGWVDDGIILAWLWTALQEDLSRYAARRGLDLRRYRLPPPPPEPAE